MDTEGVERVVVAQLALRGDGPITDDARECPDGECPRRCDEPTGGRNGNETGHDARGEPERGRFAAVQPFDNRPRKTRHRGGNLRDGECTHRLRIAVKCRTAVEAEPAEPEHPRTQQRERHVTRVESLFAVAVPLAEQEHSSEATEPGCNVNHRATGKVDRPVRTEQPRGGCDAVHFLTV